MRFVAAWDSWSPRCTRKHRSDKTVHGTISNAIVGSSAADEAGRCSESSTSVVSVRVRAKSRGACVSLLPGVVGAHGARASIAAIRPCTERSQTLSSGAARADEAGRCSESSTSVVSARVRAKNRGACVLLLPGIVGAHGARTSTAASWHQAQMLSNAVVRSSGAACRRRR